MFCCFSAHPQEFNRLGNPIVTYYYPEEFSIPEQSWCIAQDKRGIMYFGTTENGVLEYDGKNWRKIATHSRVLSMTIDSSGILYLGLEGDFGYLKPNHVGSLEYSSLTHLLSDSLRSDVTSVYRTYNYKGNIYFCTPKYIFIARHNNIQTIPLARFSFTTSICNDDILVGNIDEGLLRIINGNAQVDKNAGILKEKDIYSILPVSKNDYWVITNEGLFSYKQDTKKISIINDQHGYLKKIPSEGIIPYNANIIGNGNVGVGCVNTNWLSYFEMNPRGELVNIINKNAGLLGSQITNLYQTDHNPMWFTFYDGSLAKVESHSQIKQFTSSNGLEGVISGILRHNGTLYVGTSNGVFYLDFNADGFPIFRKIKDTDTWALIEFKMPGGGGIPLVASVNGVLRIEGKKAVSICDTIDALKFYAMSLHQSKLSPDKLYIGTSNTIYSINCKNGKGVNRTLRQLARPEQNVGEIKYLTEDKYGNLWASSSTRKLICINPKNSDFYSFEGCSSLNGEVFPVTRGDSLYALTKDGIYHYNYADSTFTRGGIVGHMLDEVSVSKMVEFKNGFVFLCSNKNNDSYFVEYITKDSSNNLHFSSTPLKRLPKKWVGAIYADGDVLWLGIQKDVYTYNLNVTRNYNTRFNTLIRKVIFKDSLVFNGTHFSTDENGQQVFSLTQPENQIPRLAYRYNAFVINYSTTFYEKEEATLYSHYLEGSDEKNWSKWDTRSEATYTNLREGTYTFYVKAKNVYEKESIVATYSFVIRPPFYRTILAYLLYLISGVLLIWGIVKWNSRRLIAEKEQLEKIVQERTAEVVAQKEEIEVQKFHIEEQNEEIKSSIQYASRIQRAILSPEQQVNTIFPDNFILYLPRDIVSGDFYVITQIGNKKISVVADCTGHGVPGGFMSMLGMSSLSEIINKNADNLHANVILNLLREKIINSLHQTGEVGTSKDGMDLALYIVDETEMTLEFAGANNSMLLIRNDEVIQVKADKMPIGIYLKGDVPFTNNVMELCKGDVIYTFSDGYADQFGGTDQRKFMIKNLRNLLLEIHKKPMSEQREILDNTLKEWHGETPRIDDVVVMGVRIN